MCKFTPDLNYIVVHPRVKIVWGVGQNSAESYVQPREKQNDQLCSDCRERSHLVPDSLPDGLLVGIDPLNSLGVRSGP